MANNPTIKANIAEFTRCASLLARARSVVIRTIDIQTLWLFNDAFVTTMATKAEWNRPTWSKRRLIKQMLEDIGFGINRVKQLVKTRTNGAQGGVSSAVVDDMFNPDLKNSFMAQTRVLLAITFDFNQQHKEYRPSVVGIAVVRPFWPVTSYYTVDGEDIDDDEDIAHSREIYLVGADGRCPGVGEVVFTNALSLILKQKKYAEGIISILASVKYRGPARNMITNEPLRALCSKYHMEALDNVIEVAGNNKVPVVYRGLGSNADKLAWTNSILTAIRATLAPAIKVCKTKNQSAAERMLGAFCA
jgi:hypothetical protein